MNVHVLGSDYSQEMMGGAIDWGEISNQLLQTAVSVVGPVISQRLTPTQKSVVQQVTGTTTSVPTPQPKKTFMEENGTYLIIGGAVLVGAIILMQSRRRR